MFFAINDEGVSMIRLGILGAARIARAIFQSPLKNVTVTAIASRDIAKANVFSEEYHIPKRFGNYESLLDDKDIDAVYIALPQHLHRQFVIAAASRGKHILVEKPSALSVRELEEMSHACKKNNVFCMEAFMYRFLGIHRRTKEIVASGMLGDLRYINFNFGFDIQKRGLTGFRLDRKLGGGALYDLGIYGIDFIRNILGTQPSLLWADVRRENGNGIDLFTHAVLKSGNVMATMTCSYDMDANYFTISGREGLIHSPLAISGKIIPNVLNIHYSAGERRNVEEFSPEDSYNAEVEHFAQCIEKNEEPILGMANSIANMKLLEEIMNFRQFA